MRVFSAGHVARREHFGSRAQHHRSCISTCGNGIARRQRVTAASLAPAALLAPIGGAPARPARAFDAVPSPSQAELASFWTAPDVTAPLNAFYDRIGKALPRAMRTVPSDAEFPVDASVPLAAAGFAASIERCIVPPEVLGRCLDAFQRHMSIDAPLVACAADGVRAYKHDLDAEYSVFPVELLPLLIRMCPPQVDAYSALGVIVRDPVVLAVQWDAMVVRLRLAWAAQGVVVGNVPWNCRGCVEGAVEHAEALVRFDADELGDQSFGTAAYVANIREVVPAVLSAQQVAAAHVARVSYAVNRQRARRANGGANVPLVGVHIAAFIGAVRGHLLQLGVLRAVVVPTRVP